MKIINRLILCLLLLAMAVAVGLAAEVYRQTDPGVRSAAAWYLYATNDPSDATYRPGRYRAQVVAQTCGVSF